MAVEMRAVIEGKTYNTETSKLIGHYWNGLGGGDFGALSESLWKTRKGAYYTAGEGGAMTGYSRSCGDNSWTGGSAIHPISVGEALDWAERHLEPEEIEAEFASLLEEA